MSAHCVRRALQPARTNYHKTVVSEVSFLCLQFCSLTFGSNPAAPRPVCHIKLTSKTYTFFFSFSLLSRPLSRNPELISFLRNSDGCWGGQAVALRHGWVWPEVTWGLGSGAQPEVAREIVFCLATLPSRLVSLGSRSATPKKEIWFQIGGHSSVRRFQSVTFVFIRCPLQHSVMRLWLAIRYVFVLIGRVVFFSLAINVGACLCK